MSQWLDAFAPAASPATFFCEDASDLIAAASSQLARRDAQSGGTLLDGTIHTSLSDDANVTEATQTAGGKNFAIVDALAALLNEAQTPSRLPATFAAPITRACPAPAGITEVAPERVSHLVPVTNVPSVSSVSSVAHQINPSTCR